MFSFKPMSFFKNTCVTISTQTVLHGRRCNEYNLANANSEFDHIVGL